MYMMRIVLLLVLTVILELHALVSANATASIRLKKFRNFGSLLWDGSNCSSGTCENVMEFCINKFPPILTSFSDCLFYKKTSPVAGEEVDFELTSTAIDRDVALNFTDYKGLGLLMNVTNEPPGLSPALIDTHMYAEQFVPGFNGTAKRYSRVSFGQRPVRNSRLSFTVTISCDPFYYDNTCSTYCKAKDDSTGHYTCDTNGNRVCRNNWYRLPNCLTYCAPHDDDTNGHYTCGTNGTHVCHPNWHVLPNCTTFCEPKNDTNGHYGCNEIGERVCHKNWYNLPNCTTYCVPKDDDINGHYTCNTTGSKVCRRGWHNHPKCDTFCVPQNDTKNGHYSCDRDGTHVCHKGWFMSPNCTIFCMPYDDDLNGHYNCNSSGSHVCRDGWRNPPNCTTKRAHSSLSLQSTPGLLSMTKSSNLLPTRMIFSSSSVIKSVTKNAFRPTATVARTVSLAPSPSPPSSSPPSSSLPSSSPPETTDNRNRTFWEWLIKTDYGKAIFYGSGAGLFLIASLSLSLILCRRSSISHTRLKTIKVAPLTDFEMIILRNRRNENGISTFKD